MEAGARGRWPVGWHPVGREPGRRQGEEWPEASRGGQDLFEPGKSLFTWNSRLHPAAVVTDSRDWEIAQARLLSAPRHHSDFPSKNHLGLFQRRASQCTPRVDFLRCDCVWMALRGSWWRCGSFANFDSSFELVIKWLVIIKRCNNKHPQMWYMPTFNTLEARALTGVAKLTFFGENLWIKTTLATQTTRHTAKHLLPAGRTPPQEWGFIK